MSMSTEPISETWAWCDVGTEVVGCTCQSDDFSCKGSQTSRVYAVDGAQGVCRAITAEPGKTRSTAHARCATIRGAEHPDNWRNSNGAPSGNCNGCTSTAFCNSEQGEF